MVDQITSLMVQKKFLEDRSFLMIVENNLFEKFEII